MLVHDINAISVLRILNIEQAFPCWKKENHIGWGPCQPTICHAFYLKSSSVDFMIRFSLDCSDVLKYVKSCFYNMNTYGPFNEEAANW